MTPAIVAIGLAVAGLALLSSGGALLLTGRSLVAGGAFATAGALAVVAAYANSVGHSQAHLLAYVGVLALGAAVCAYPRPERDLASLVVLSLVVIGGPLLIWRQEVVGGGFDDADDGGLLILAVVLLVLAQVWWRMETAAPDVRRPLTWVLTTTAALTFVGMLVALAEAPAWVVAIQVAASGLIGWAAWVGATLPGIVDVRGVVARTVVGLAAAVVVFVLFEVLAQGWGLLAGAPPQVTELALVAVLCALAYEPIRRVLRTVADELLFGIRPDPVAAAGQVALSIGDEPATVLESLRTVLALPYAALHVDGLSMTESGGEAEHHRTLPLMLNNTRIGELVVGLRPGDFSLSADDAKVLGLAAPLLALAVRDQALAQSLQSAREATTRAREEERLRMRRDLHDGLGPRMAGIAFTADAARLSTHDPGLLDTHLERVRHESVSAIREIREIVHGLRPPALDEVGLVEAIRLQAASLQGLRVEVVGEDLPLLNAAVEVAAYRIVTEALTNAARHSGADDAWATLTADEHCLTLEIRDAGTGDGTWTPGVGLTSMRERAAELGGTLTVVGGVVRAELPLDAAHPSV